MKALTPEGEALELGNLLGQGGEGAVYRVPGRPGAAAKIWNSGTNNPETRRKLRAMLDNPPPQGDPPGVAWPTGPLNNERGEPAGFLMPLLDPREHRSIFQYFNPGARRGLERRANIRVRDRELLTIARNLSAAVAAVHQAGHVIGDVNEKNVMVGDRLQVTLVDADSMQVQDTLGKRTHRCTKGRDDYTPPRLQGKTFRDHDRTQDDDRFGLAILIFKTLMEGVHPFASTSSTRRKNSISLADKIRSQYFPYNESGHTPQEHQPSPSYREAWLNTDFQVRHLFRRAFDPEATSRGERPSPQEWNAELDRLIREGWKRPRRRRAAPQPSQDRSRGTTQAPGSIAAPRGRMRQPGRTASTSTGRVTLMEAGIGLATFSITLGAAMLLSALL